MKCPLVTSSPQPFWVYYRSLWWSSRQEMWSSSSGAMCCSVPAPRDPLCDSQDLCHCPHSTQNNFCCAFFFFFFVSIVCGHFGLNKSAAPPFDISADAVLETVQQGSVGCFHHGFCFHRNKSSLRVTTAAGVYTIICNSFWKHQDINFHVHVVTFLITCLNCDIFLNFRTTMASKKSFYSK